MKYFFENIENGQIAEGYTSIKIINHEAEVDPADTEAILLAEKRGGQLKAPQKQTAEKPAGGNK
jgi:hypothetical protein